MIDHQYYVIPGRIGPNLCKFVKSVVPFLSRNKSISKSLPGGPIPHNMAKTALVRYRFRAPRRCGYIPRPFGKGEGLVRMWSSPCRRDGEVEKSALRAVTSYLFGQERGLVRDVESSLEGGTRWFEEFRSHPSHKHHPLPQR